MSFFSVSMDTGQGVLIIGNVAVYHKAYLMLSFNYSVFLILFYGSLEYFWQYWIHLLQKNWIHFEIIYPTLRQYNRIPKLLFRLDYLIIWQCGILVTTFQAHMINHKLRYHFDYNSTFSMYYFRYVGLKSYLPT